MAGDSLYDTDIVAWAEQQVEELRRLARTAPSNAVDWENVIEEVESVGRSEVSGVERHLVLILAHLTNWLSSPETLATRGWRAEILAFQQIVQTRFSPSMRQKLDLDRIWRHARKDAAAGLAYYGDQLIGGLPDTSPFTLDELASSDFEPDAALARLAGSLRSGGR